MFPGIGAILSRVGTKNIQRGTTAGAGAVAITQVVLSKTFVLSKSKGSAGYVAATGSLSLTPTGGTIVVGAEGSNSGHTSGTFPTYSGLLSGGSTDLTVKEYSAYLQDSTHIYADGAVEYQVIEFR